MASGGKPPPGAAPVSGTAPHYDWSYIADMFLRKTYNSSKGHYGDWINDETWRKLNHHNARSPGFFHPSSGLVEDMGACERLIIFDLLCAPQSESKVPIHLARILENGSNRHIGLHVLFLGMAAHRFMGIKSYYPEPRATHTKLPISGSADGLVEMDNGWRYVLDFKTIKSENWAKLYNPEPKHIVQVQTYVEILDAHAGYVIYENKNNQKWATPMERMRVQRNPTTKTRIEAFCHSVLEKAVRYQLPVFNERTCKDNLTFCKYVDVCTQARGGAKLQQFDRRSDDVKEWHQEALR